ncbi:MAG TPA: ATP-binding protein [Kofleriaceae bacterium]
MTSTRNALFVGNGELATLMRNTDWAATPLGPVESWPNGLRAAVRIVLSSRFSMWMAWGEELTFLYNDAYRRDTLGAKHPRALGMPTRELWSEIWTDIGPRIATVLETGEATWDEDLLLMLERNGYREETYHTFSYSPLFDDDGRIRGVLSVVTEETARLISERRVALLGALGVELGGANTDETVLAGLQRALATETRDLPFALAYVFDEDGRTARLAARCSEWGAEEPDLTIELATGAAWRLDELARERRPLEIALHDAAWPTGAWQTPPRHAFVLPLAQQGQDRLAGALICGLNPHRAFDVAYRDFLVLFANQLASGLAAARAYELERRRAEALAELDRAKTTFFSNVSHEFRTPLTLMLGPLEDLLADPDQLPAAHEDLTTVQRNGLRLLKLVNTMLDFSRIEAGRAQVSLRPTELAQLTADLASMFRAATDKAGLALHVECEPLGTPVDVDPDMWEKIVLNLISNAFKFTLRGEIAVALARRGDRVELSVRDTGCGIPQAELPHVFERFHRVEGTRGRSYEGTGIGLALVQELVRLHGGTISVASTEAQGSTFIVSFPIRAARSNAMMLTANERVSHSAEMNAYVAEALRWLPEEADARTAAPVSRDRILIADDNADMLSYLRRLLSPRWEVDAVSNGRAALDAIRNRPPALVITDVMMPDLDGFGLIAALRADPAHAKLPVIMLSARAGEEARVEGLRAGATDYLVKPFASRELIARVDSLLRSLALQAAEKAHAQRIAMIFEQAPVAIAVLRGREHVYEVANTRYRAIIGQDDVLGRKVGDVLPEVVSQGIIDLLDDVFRTGQPYTANAMTIQLASVSGRLHEHLFDLVFQPLFDADDQVYGIVAIGHDVTALANAQRVAESASRAKDEFLAMLGHELRNPLAPITTALELMRLRPNLGAERERAIIQRQVQHLIGLVDDLLDVSRITRGKIELRTDQVAIADVISQAVEQTSPLLEQQRHTLTLDVADGLLVRGDRARLTQIVANLLANAAKYTPPRGTLHVRAQHIGAEIVVAVVDNGIGIDQSMLSRIFEPFAQSRQSLDRSRGGLGLGLAIVDNLVRLHGGTVTVTSEGPNRGSEFTVRLPVLDGAAAASAQSPPVVARSSRGDGRILIVDDNIDAAQMLADLLGAHGYRTLATHDGPSALKALEAFSPHVAVLDLGLPVMDGYELARALRSRPESAATRLIALTGYGQPEDRARSAAAGFAAHVVKPIDGNLLRSMIDRLIEE